MGGRSLVDSLLSLGRKELADEKKAKAGLKELGEAGRARKARGRAQGYDVDQTHYHGSIAHDIDEFRGEKGVAGHFSRDPAQADEFAGGRYADTSGDDARPTVYPVHLRTEKTFDLRNPEHRALVGISKDEIATAVDEIDHAAGNAPFFVLERNVDKIREAGFDSYLDWEFSIDQPPINIAVLDPENIRSVNAQFKDPKSRNLLAGTTGAAVLAGTALAPEEAEAGMRDVGLEMITRPIGRALRTHAGERAVVKGAREAAEGTAVLTAAEKAAVRKAWERDGVGTLKGAMESARATKARFPSKGVDTPWAPFEIGDMEISAGRGGKISYKPVAKQQRYGFHFDPATGKEASRQSQYYQNMVDSVANEIIAIKRMADNGDPAAIKIMSNMGWYKNVERRGFNEYGSFYDMFGDLLGSTSPVTALPTNFHFSRDLLTRATRGDFDNQIDQFADIMDQVEQLEVTLANAEDVSRYVGAKKADLTKSPRRLQTKQQIKDLKGQINKITQESGKKYGANSTNAMIALAERWRIFRAGDAPKARNFSGNLVGYSLKPTIDIWSARNLRRHAGLAPLPIPAEKGVVGKIVDPVAFTSDMEFGFGQDVLTDAAVKVNAALGTNIDPRDMQALQWFAEKDYWSRKGWTNVAGEGGSLETMMDMSPTESLVAALSREQSMANQGRDFIPGPKDQLVVAQRLMRETAADPDVVASKAPTTQGLYGGAPETAFDVDIVSKEHHVPASTLDQVAIQAVEDSQADYFVARRIKPEVGTERPEMFQVGVEAYFHDPISPDSQEIQDLLAHLQKKEVQGFTLIVDPRKKPGAMADEVIGVRFLDIPQLYDPHKFAKMSEDEYRQHVIGKYDEYTTISDGLKTAFPDIRSADTAFFDVNVQSRGSAEDYVAQLSNAERDPDVLRQEAWGFKPARTRFKEYTRESQPYYSQSGAGALTPKTRRARFLDSLGEDPAGIQGALNEDGSITLVHYSRKPLDRVDPEQYGKGLAGRSRAERNRSADPDFIKRSYYGVEAGDNPYRKEQGLGPYRHEVQLGPDELYPINQDPDGLYDAANPSRSEAAIAERGYSGYLADHPKLGKVAVVFDPYDVTKKAVVTLAAGLAAAGSPEQALAAYGPDSDEYVDAMNRDLNRAQAGQAAGQFAQRRLRKQSYWKELRQDLIDSLAKTAESIPEMINSALTAGAQVLADNPMAQAAAFGASQMPWQDLEQPVQGVAGMAATGAGLAQGQGLDQALQQGANWANMPQSEIGYEAGGLLADRGHPLMGTAVNTAIQVSGF